MMNIAIIGTGVSGLGAAHVLQRQHQVTLFEQASWVGGHAHTVDADGQPVDTGFIVYNESNYPLLSRLFRELGVETAPTDMSFGMHNPTNGMAYSSRGLSGLFARPQNALRPRIYRMIRELGRFNRLARAALAENRHADITLGEFLDGHGFSDVLKLDYIVPMSAAIWSAPPGRMLGFPALTFFRFFNNHGLLSYAPDIPWRTVVGGSRKYVQVLIKPIAGRVHCNCPVRAVRRLKDAVCLSFADRPDQTFDRVVIATHADQALRLLANPSDDERRLLQRFPYQSNRVVLHRDPSVLPPYPRAWASWTVNMPPAEQLDQPIAMTYDMNRLQNIPLPERYLVTLNPASSWQSKATEKIYYQTDYTHPAYDNESFRVQPELAELNAQGPAYFCGAYFGYGFHEDGLRSGVEVARALGVEW